MYKDLCRNRSPILTVLRFYERHDLLPPDIVSSCFLTKDEEEELGQKVGALMQAAGAYGLMTLALLVAIVQKEIVELCRFLTEDEEEELRQVAGALAEAAEASGLLNTAVLVATLLKVAKNPSLFSKRTLPAAVEWAIACDYQRGEEPLGTHWRDVWGDQVSRFTGEVEQPTEANIAKAALAAIATIQESRKLGRPYNLADQILADRLGEIFRGSGQPIRRSQQPVMREGEVGYVEGGPFYDFLGLVLKPLQRYLSERRRAPVTVDTIVRLVTENFPRA
ncbi:hypothetical protein JQ620_20070 [Bradyrhizobium sp. AUGA SZCCT0274]|nr:hypothetical protein [Bradyrhizobium sp. AUGA SZCCT0274]MBR1242408.1 hypothetical protein [Bradyrhizobium sp. AUGA SZCCT0274]